MHALGTWGSPRRMVMHQHPHEYNQKHLRQMRTMETEPPALLLQCPIHGFRCSCPPESCTDDFLLCTHLPWAQMSLCPLVRAPEAFVSIQLEKVGLRDMMLNAFLLRKQTMADRMKNLVSAIRRVP